MVIMLCFIKLGNFWGIYPESLFNLVKNMKLHFFLFLETSISNIPTANTTAANSAAATDAATAWPGPTAATTLSCSSTTTRASASVSDGVCEFGSNRTRP